MVHEEKKDPSIPVDRGWAWVILAGTLIISTINVGTEKSFGIFFIEFLRKFKGTVSMTAMITSFTHSVYCIGAVLVLTFGVKRFSVRMFVFIGIILRAIGYGLSSFATGLEYLILSQSILIGAGLAFFKPPIFLLIEGYFEKRKGFANAVYISGNALGGFIMPPVYRYIFDEYGLNGGLVLTAGITLNSLVAAALLRPTEFYTKPNKNPRPSSYNKGIRDDDKTCEIKRRVLNEKDEFDKKCESDTSDPLIEHELNETSISKQTQSSHMQHNEVLDKVSHSSIVRYLSNGNIASTSVNSITGRSTHDEMKACSPSITNITDCKVIKNSLFCLFLLIYCLGNMAVMCAPVYITTLAKDTGIDDSRVAILLSLTSLVDFFGRIFCGYLADRPWITPQRIIIISQVVVGVVVQFTTFYTTFWHLVVFVVLLGFTAGMIAALFPPMVIKIVGKEDYAKAMAMFIVVVSLFNGATFPFLGYLRDITNTYHLTFHVIGACSLITVVLLILFDVISKRRARAEGAKETAVDV